VVKGVGEDAMIITGAGWVNCGYEPSGLVWGTHRYLVIPQSHTLSFTEQNVTKRLV
jgi:hypothetical protein